MALEDPAHVDVLGEHERPLADVDELVDELVEAGELARPAGDAAGPSPNAFVGWLQICLSCVSAARTSPRRFIPCAALASVEQLVDDLLVEQRLLAGEPGAGDLLDLVGQIGDERCGPPSCGAARTAG